MESTPCSKNQSHLALHCRARRFWPHRSGWSPAVTMPYRPDRVPSHARGRQRDGSRGVPEQREPLHGARRRVRGRLARRGRCGAAPGRLRLRADAVRPRRRRPLVPRLRRDRADRADGADRGAVDPVPPPRGRRRALGAGDDRCRRPPQRGRHGADLGRRPPAQADRRRPGHLRPAGGPLQPSQASGSTQGELAPMRSRHGRSALGTA